MATRNIMVVEDEGIVAADIESRLQKLGYGIAAVVNSGEEAIDRVAQANPDLILMDIALTGRIDGVETAELIRKNFDIPIVFLTAHADPSTLQRAKITGPYGYIVKPFEGKDLHATIEMALYRFDVEAKVKKMERWLATTLHSIGDAVLTTNLQGQITFLNPVAEVLTGWTFTEALGLDSTKVFRIIKEKTRSPIKDPVQRAIKEGLIIYLTGDVLLINKDGNEILIDDSAAPIRDHQGKIMGAVLVFRDATERRKAEEKIRTLNQQLERRAIESAAQLEATKKRMETFIYTVSHDLRAPLRAIDGFAQLLNKTYSPQLDEEGKHFLETIRLNSKRMRQLIDDYLAFIGIGARSISLHTLVDMNSLVQSVFNELHSQTPGRSVELKSQRLPKVRGDEVMLRQVWINLLGNAIKYTSQRENAVIEVGSYPQKNEKVFYIKDNGAGFDPQYAGKLFEAFQRLHSVHEFEGTGLGLAIVKRVVDLHSGRVWAEGKPGRGATFYFSIPNTKPIKKT